MRDIVQAGRFTWLLALVVAVTPGPAAASVVSELLVPELQEIFGPDPDGSFDPSDIIPGGAVVPEATPEWVRQFGSTDYDIGLGVAANSTGMLVASGVTYGDFAALQRGAGDAWVARFDPSGTEVWKRQLGTLKVDVATAVALDSADNVIVAGLTGGSLFSPSKAEQDGWVLKLDALGRTLWQRQPGTPKTDRIAAIAIGPDDSIYLAGQTSLDPSGLTPGDFDGWIVKLGADGRSLWRRRPGTDRQEFASGIATDPAGNVYVVGGTDGALAGPRKGDFDAWLIKYDADGRVLWSRQPGTNRVDAALGVATDLDGNVYVVGVTRNWLGGPYQGGDDAWLMKFDPDGRRLWTVQRGTAYDDWATSVATDVAGNVYVTGGSHGALAGITPDGVDVWTSKFDSTGAAQWEHQTGLAAHDDQPGRIAIDGTGSVYVVGTTTPQRPGRIPNPDALLIKYPADGLP